MKLQSVVRDNHKSSKPHAQEVRYRPNCTKDALYKERLSIVQTQCFIHRWPEVIDDYTNIY